MGYGKGDLQCAAPSNTRSGLYTANKLLTVLLLQAPMCRVSVGWRFRKDKAGRSSYSKMRVVLRNVQSLCTSQRTWERGLITYVVIECLYIITSTPFWFEVINISIYSWIFITSQYDSKPVS